MISAVILAFSLGLCFGCLYTYFLAKKVCEIEEQATQRWFEIAMEYLHLYVKERQKRIDEHDEGDDWKRDS
jgi:hypothetical protein